MKRKIKYILILLLIGNITFSQTSITMNSSQDSVLIGDHITLDITLKSDDFNDISSIDFSNWKSIENMLYEIDTTILSEFTETAIIGNNEWGITDTNLSIGSDKINTLKNNSDSLSMSIVVSIYEFGGWILSPPKVNHKSGKNYPKGKPSLFFVMDPNIITPQDSLSLMPIKDIIAEGESWEDYKTWFYILGLILLAPLLIRLFWGRKKEEDVIVEKEIFIPAHKKALTALESLKNKELWQTGNIKEYQSELTDIVRRYLGDRFDVNALEMTTDEINRALRNKDFDTKHSAMLQRVLTIADLVKFAKATPPVEINAEFMDEAVAFVETTKKVEVQDFKTETN